MTVGMDESLCCPTDLCLDDAMKIRLLPRLPDLEIEDEAVSTWNIEDYRDLPTKVRGPKFVCGGHPWYELVATYESCLK